jgi:hypothetical protein
MIKKFILVLFLAITIISDANAQSTLALQEKCAEGARKFLKDYASEFICSQNNHYNKKLDKCFIRIFCFNSGTKVRSIEVYDVFESVSLGSYVRYIDGSLIGCDVGRKVCNSMEEFEALIKPYMEE